MNKINCIIIDDEPKARELLKLFIAKINYINILDEAENGLEAVKKIDSLKPDLVFLDIQMPKLTGFEVLEILQFRPNVIFTTAYDEFALKAFEENAVDYLLKPFSFERFSESVERIQNKIGREEVQHKEFQSNPKLNRIVVKEGNKISLINHEEIESIKANDDYVIIKSDKGEYVKNKTLKHFESILDKNNFIRVHRSSLVNFNKISSMNHVSKENYELKMISGDRVRISKNNIKHIKELLNF